MEISMRNSQLLTMLVASSITFITPAFAGDSTGCPAAVKTAIDKAFAKSTIGKCKSEHEDGRDQFEVKLTKADGSKADVDVTPDGKILQIEEKIDLAKVPAAVMKAFAAKYPKAKVERGEKQTSANGSVSYELAFTANSGRKEATFTQDGKFVEEE
jgi:hypothetical protein